jgi:hypothetical protein
MAQDAPPPSEAVAKGVDRVREAAKWLIGAFAAIGGVLIAGSQLSSLGGLEGGRLLLAVLAAVLALVGLALAIWLVFDIMLPSQATLHDLVEAERRGDQGLGTIARDHPELLQGYSKKVAGLQSSYRAALIQRRRALEGNYQTPPTVSDDEVLRANNRVTSIGYAVDAVLSVAVYLALDRKLRSQSRKWLLFAAALGTAVAIIGFVFAANPPQDDEAGGDTTAGLQLDGALLPNASLAGQDLSNANLEATTLSDADLRAADLRDATITNARWEGADLRGANLNGADLRNSDLSQADLRGADLSEADLTNADLAEADLAHAKMSGITWSNTTCPDGALSEDKGGSCV